jgi:hypothetical protein
MPTMSPLDQLCARLLGELSATLPGFDLLLLAEFVDAGEYGSALESYVDMCVEYARQPAPAELALVRELAGCLELDAADLLGPLAAPG